MDNNFDTEYYTVSEAAKRLSVSSTTVWRWIDSGKLPAYRVGPKKIRIKRVDLKKVTSPARTAKDILADYDPVRFRKALEECAGSWSDVDTDKLISDIYKAREEGSRPPERP